MTEEEIAEINLAEAWVGENGFGSDCNNLNSAEANREMVTAFLAGLKAGKPKLHKVADCLPKDNRLVLIYMVNGNTTMGIYYVGAWREICNCKELSGVLAWCEIPKYTEE